MRNWIKRHRDRRSWVWIWACRLANLTQARCTGIGRRNRLAATGAVLRGVRITVRGRGNTISIEHGAVVRKAHLTIIGDDNKIEIGEYTHVTGEFWIEDSRSVISVGERTVIGGGHLAATESRSLRIGAGCMLSSEVDIRTGDSHSIVDADGGRRLNPARDVVIEDHVWVGKRVTILKGAIIGSGSIVGACSLVTGEFGSNVVLAGVPAKVVRTGVTWRPERI